jgi:hypothetical protein
MSADLSNPSAPVNPVRDALAEIRACQEELQTFVAGVFDRLDGLANELLERETAPQQADRKMMHSEIAQLAAVATDLADLVAEQKRLIESRTPR